MPLWDDFEEPNAFRLRNLASSMFASTLQRRDFTIPDSTSQLPAIMSGAAGSAISTLNDHSSHPDFIHLAGLVTEAVLEVVVVALPGFIIAWYGHFTADQQKFVAELNTMVFTPCLIFTKLAGQLNTEQLADLAVIPLIFVAQTIVSYISAQLMSWVFGFWKKNKKMQKNFVIAMGVFGNSNSLPISLVISLSATISGLHWDKIPGDNDNEVAARGILYLMIFQQLGQLLRWTWGYSVLLRPAEAYEIEEREDDAAREDRLIEGGRYTDEDPDAALIDVDDSPKPPRKPADSGFGSSGSETPESSASSDTSEDVDDDNLLIPTTPIDTRYISHVQSRSSGSQNSDMESRDARARSTGHITTFPDFSHTTSHKDFGPDPTYTGWKAPFLRFAHFIRTRFNRMTTTLSTFFYNNIYRRLPSRLQSILSTLHHYHCRFWAGVWRQMNPPLWAMLAALIVASIPDLQKAFFTKGTLVNNSITRAIAQSGGVAVPLILFVLGANLARSTLPSEALADSAEEKREERKLLFASLLSRMVLPTIVMAPVLALMAKYLPVSILDDPIFIIVCFLLTGAPSALQLAQICQINGVFMGAMSNLLVASYVVAIFPSTLTLVLLALEVLEWAVI